MNRSILFILLAIFTFGFQACENSSKTNKHTHLNEENSFLIQNKLGETRIPKSPERVVIFDLGALDIFDELGLQDRVVGIPKQTIPSYLEKYKNNYSIINTGSLVEPNFQQVNEANPDLIIIGTRQEKDFEVYNKVAPTLFYDNDYADYVGSISENLKQIGKIFDLKQEADAIDKEMLQDIQRLSAKPHSLKGLFVMYNNGKFSAYGKNSRFGFLHDSFGIPPVSKDIEASRHGLSISSEYIQEMNPEILFVLDRNAAIGEGKIHKSAIENGLIKETSAYKNNRIIYLSPQVWYLAGGGVTSLKMMAKEVEEIQ